MCDAATMKLVETVVQEKCQKGEKFTAYDVTRAVRDIVGRGTPIPHNDVKQEVHNLFANSFMGNSYTRELANMPGLNPQPWLYYQSNITVTGVNPAAIVDGGDDDGVNQTADGNYKVDGRGTLCIPKALLEACNLKAGDTAFVAADALQGHIVVSQTTPDATILTNLSNYTVDKYGNVRITQAVLQNGGCGGQEYTIDLSGVTVIVKKVN